MKNIEEEVNMTMHSLDGIHKADPGPFFYTRLSARMEVRSISIRWYWKLAMVAIFFINIASFLLVGNAVTKNSTDTPTDVSSEYLYYVPDYELTLNEDML